MGKEKWIDVPGYIGLYQVSDKARIKSLDRVHYRNGFLIKLKGKILKQHISKRGYYCVKLSKNGVTKTRPVHRYSGLFVPNPENLPCFNHKDGNKLNSLPYNLDPCTQKQNMQHAYRTGLIVRKSGQYCKLSKKIIDSATGNVYANANEAAKELGLKRGTLVCYLSGHRTNKTNLVYAES